MVDGYECSRLTDTSFGRRLQYAIKLDKFAAKQWLQAHNEVMRSLSPDDRQSITSKTLKDTVVAWLNRHIWLGVKARGLTAERERQARTQ